MEEQLQTPNQPVPAIPPADLPAQAGNKRPVWLPFLVIFIALILAGIAIVLQIKQALFTVPSPSTSTPAPTAAVSRRLSALATDSAFLLLESSASTLSGRVNALSVQDSTLAPPILDLPLGFRQ